MAGQQAIAQIFNQYLGRQPSAAELQGFNDLMGAGTLDPIGLSLFIQGTPEYLKKVAPTIAQEYAGAIGGFDDAYTKPLMERGFRQADASLRAKGRPQSSALASSYAKVTGNVYGNLAEQRSRDVAGLLAPFYGSPTGVSNVGYGTYGSAVGRSRDLQDREFQIKQDELYRADNMRVAKQNQAFGLGAGALNALGKTYGMYRMATAGGF